MTSIATSEEKVSSPVFVALQVSDSSQPALVPIATHASRYIQCAACKVKNKTTTRNENSIFIDWSPTH